MILDKTSKLVISVLKTLPDATYYYIDNYPDGLPQQEKFFAAIRYLVRKDLAEIVHNQRGQHIGVRLTHEAIHYKEFFWISALRYVMDNWISFVSLLISLFALVVSVTG